MKVRIFYGDKDGKVTFTRSELEKLLNDVYDEGYNEGKRNYWTYTTPSITSTPTWTITSNCGGSITDATSNLNGNISVSKGE